MKVALELQPCRGSRTGIGIYAYELARRMRDGGGLTFCGNLFNFLGRDDNSAALAGVTMPIRENRLFLYGVYRRIWDLVPIRYDSLFPGGADLNVFFNYIVPPRVEGKILTTIHDMTYLRYPEMMDKRNLKRIRDGLERSVEASSAIITVSEFSKREIAGLLHIPEKQIAVIYNAPSVREQKTEKTDVLAAKGIVGPYLLYVGTIEPRKNIVRLIKAFARLKKEQNIPHKLVLAGGKGWNNEEIYRMAQTVSCADDIRFIGYVTGEEKNALYKNAAAFVFPSLYEGFGIPPLEAMSFDCPVLTANAASLPEVVGDAAALVDPLDELGIAEGIWHILSDEAYAGELVRRGREQVKKYTWGSSAQRLTELCRTVLGVS